MAERDSLKAFHSAPAHAISGVKNIPDKIFLCGFMGAGKSTVGRILAGLLGYAFADTDAEIELEAGMKISELVEAEGFACFRLLERRLFRRLAAERSFPGFSGIVISCGGGIYPVAQLRSSFKKGISIFIDVPEDILFRRLRLSAEQLSRPKLRIPNKFGMLPQCSDSSSSLKKKISSLLARRRQYYMRCSAVFKAGDSSAVNIAEGLASLLSDASRFMAKLGDENGTD